MRLVLIIGVLALTVATFFFANQSLVSLVAGDDMAEQAAAALAEQVVSLEGQISDLETTNQAQAAQIETLTARQFSLAAGTDGVATELAAAAENIDGLTMSLSEERGKVQALEADLRRAETENTLIEEQLAALRTAAMEASTISNSETGELEERVENMSASLAAAEQEIATLKAEAEAHAAAVGGFSDEAAAADAEIAALKSEIAEMLAAAEERDTPAEEVIASAPPADLPTISSCTTLTNAAFADQKVTFDRGTSSIAAASQPTLEQLIRDFQACADANLIVEIGGHTDSRGGELSNQRLSEDRARAVLDFLYAGGVPSVAMRAVGYGESAPIADNSTSEGRSQNRRITFDWQQR